MRQRTSRIDRGGRSGRSRAQRESAVGTRFERSSRQDKPVRREDRDVVPASGRAGRAGRVGDVKSATSYGGRVRRDISKSAATAHPSVGRRQAAQREEASGAEFVSGRRAVLEALRSGRPINKLVVAEGAAGGSLAEILARAREVGVVVQRAPRATLTAIGDATQGVIAYVSPKEYVDLDDIVARSVAAEPLVIILDGVVDPHNFGAILRTAEAVGAQGVVIPKRRAAPLTGVVAKAAAGAMEYVPVARVPNLSQAIATLQQRGYWVVGASGEAEEIYTQVDYRGPIAVVIGGEGEGIGRLLQERCDLLVKIPMKGKIGSLNASVAAGVMLFEVLRQRSLTASSATVRSEVQTE